jgi:hypothetical protein
MVHCLPCKYDCCTVNKFPVVQSFTSFTEHCHVTLSGESVQQLTLLHVSESGSGNLLLRLFYFLIQGQDGIDATYKRRYVVLLLKCVVYNGPDVR